MFNDLSVKKFFDFGFIKILRFVTNFLNFKKIKITRQIS